MSGEIIVITQEGDIVTILRAMRGAAADLGFGVTDSTRIVTAASELACDLYHYARRGVMCWRKVEREGMPGLELRFEDNGPGIPNVELALQKGYTTGDGLGERRGILQLTEGRTHHSGTP